MSFASSLHPTRGRLRYVKPHVGCFFPIFLVCLLHVQVLPRYFVSPVAMILVNARRYRVALASAVLVCLILGLTSYHGQVFSGTDSWPKWATSHHENEQKPTTTLSETKPKPTAKPTKTKLPSPPIVTPGLPKDYHHEEPNSDWCENRYGTAYLEKYRGSEFSYCTPESASDLHCFWSDTTGDRLDDGQQHLTTTKAGIVKTPDGSQCSPTARLGDGTTGKKTSTPNE